MMFLLEANMADTVSVEGGAWCRGDGVILLRDWLGVRRGAVGTVLNLLEKKQSPGTILLVEWNTGGGWMSIEDDLVERLPPRAELHD
jgi:hypothetical protein